MEGEYVKAGCPVKKKLFGRGKTAQIDQHSWQEGHVGRGKEV